MSLRFLLLSPLSTPLLSCTVCRTTSLPSNDTVEGADVDSLNSRYLGIIITALKDHELDHTTNPEHVHDGDNYGDNGNFNTIDIQIKNNEFVILYASYLIEPSTFTCTFCIVCPKTLYNPSSHSLYSKSLISISSSLLTSAHLSDTLSSKVSSENVSYTKDVNNSTVNTLSVERESEDPETVDWLVGFEEGVVRGVMEELGMEIVRR